MSEHCCQPLPKEMREKAIGARVSSEVQKNKKQWLQVAPREMLTGNGGARRENTFTMRVVGFWNMFHGEIVGLLYLKILKA